MYIGGYHHRSGLVGVGFDNFQIFNKALAKDEITILALANKDSMTDKSRPSSIILFNENLILAYDFEQNSTENWI